MLIFQNTETNQQYSFHEKINLVMDQDLSVALAKENFNNTDTPIIIGDGNLTPIHELFQIKVNVKGTGFFIANFKKDEMNEELKNEIFEKLKQLRSDGEVTDESQKEKIRRMLEILSTYKPIFISFVNNGTPILTKSEFNFLINKETFESVLLVLMLPFDFLLPPSTGEKSKKSFLGFFKKNVSEPKPKTEKPEPVEKEEEIDNEEINEPSKVKAHMHADAKLLKKYGYDYLFIILFGLIMASSFLFGLALAFKGDASSVFLFVISAIFMGINGYALYSHQQSVKGWKYTLHNIKFPLVSIILGIGLGLGVGYLIAYFVIKGTEENPLNFGMIMLISSFTVIGMSIVSIFIPEIVRFVRKKVVKK